MRITIFIGLTLAGAPVAVTAQDSPDSQIGVSARLMSIEQQAGCGVMHIGSIARYSVVAGPRALAGAEIEVFVPCAEMPRQTYSSDAGDLETFAVGALHHLVLSRENLSGATVSTTQQHAGLFFLRSASLQAVRPNKSLERTRGR